MAWSHWCDYTVACATATTLWPRSPRMREESTSNQTNQNLCIFSVAVVVACIRLRLVFVCQWKIIKKTEKNIFIPSSAWCIRAVSLFAALPISIGLRYFGITPTAHMITERIYRELTVAVPCHRHKLRHWTIWWSVKRLNSRYCCFVRQSMWQSN